MQHTKLFQIPVCTPSGLIVPLRLSVGLLSGHDVTARWTSSRDENHAGRILLTLEVEILCRPKPSEPKPPPKGKRASPKSKG
jgi:hypothetical protein